ncbi:MULTISPECIES: hypothetical protein [unclassified Microbacterium]|uniref:hypothetical protein n=1 Tax=unclassified Microbacterium TaxID=2609290 RepID=UPI001AEE14DF|nr:MULTISPECIES: hypothetical protein [unclassified Microbacterium]QYM64460.1 hypothetical protein K1X59_00560 [Microbacterium sp. Se5.02b]
MSGIFATGAAAAAAEPEALAEPKASVTNEQALASALLALDERVTPVDVRLTGNGVEKDYEFGRGSILTVIETPPIPSGASDLMVAALSVGSDYNGQYIQFSPADQRSFLTGGSTLLLGSLGLLLGPFGALLLGSLGGAIGPQMEQLTCAAHNQSIRYNYTLDGNFTNVRCV